jgi:hypothetical protein
MTIKASSVLARAQRHMSQDEIMFQYIELAISTIFSPQVMLLALVFYVLVYRPDIVDRIKSMKLFGAEIDLAHIEKSIDQAVTKITHLEDKLDNLKFGYINKSATEFDPIAPAKDLDKLGRELKAMAAALDDIDFVVKYLVIGAKPEEVYAAGCAIQVRPQPKFLLPLIDYITALSTDKALGGIRLRIAFKLLQCIEKIITTDGRRDQKVIRFEDIQITQHVLNDFAKHPVCCNDRPSDGSDGIPSKVEKLVKKFETEIDKRKRHLEGC